MAVPERDELYDFLSPRDAAAAYNPEGLRYELGIPGDVYDTANTYVENGSLMSAIPIEGTQQRAEAIAFAKNDALTQYEPTQYRNLANDPISPNQYRGPAQLSEVPTATSNPGRPRTVAAGYDPRRAVLSLVFRDGTFYNYYEVTPDTWFTFRSLASKGSFIADSLDQHPRGPAEVGDISPEVRAAIYQVSRTAQTRFSGGRAPGLSRSMPVTRVTSKSSLGKAPKAPKPPKPKKR
jgi:hypothetical protein